MAVQDTFEIEVAPDFLERQTKAKPLQGVAELVWNALDADALHVGIEVTRDAMGEIGSIVVSDDGHGMPRDEAAQLFSHLGGSWKRLSRRTKTRQRMLHGLEGRGRFKAFGLGRVVDWNVVYRTPTGELRRYTISMTSDNLRRGTVSEEERVANGAPGVEVVVSEPLRQFRLDSDDARQELSEIFALYLKDYRDVEIRLEGRLLDPTAAIQATKKFDLPEIAVDGESLPAELEIVEWRTATKRALYLCNEGGFPLSQVATRFHAGDFQFSAYVKSPLVSRLHEEGQLDLVEMNPLLSTLVQAAQEWIKAHFREQTAERARRVVDEWKAENIYPFEGTPSSPLERAERQVFEIVAVNVSDYLPDFTRSPAKNRALHLRLLRSAIESSPEDLRLILDEVLNLPKKKQQELASLLRETSLSAIIGVAKIVADRLKFLSALETIVFDAEMKQRLRERSQLHHIVADNTWLFGEEYSLAVSDRSLTEVLVKHRAILGDEIVFDRPVHYVDKERGIVDLMLSRALKGHRAGEVEHLVVELKAPRVRMGSKEVVQLEKYAMAVAADERFRTVGVRWMFWLVSNDMDDYVLDRIAASPSRPGMAPGVISVSANKVLGIKTWGDLIEENRARLHFFREKLEHQVDDDEALRGLQEKYAKFLAGVVPEEPGEESGGEGETASGDSHHLRR